MKKDTLMKHMLDALALETGIAVNKQDESLAREVEVIAHLIEEIEPLVRQGYNKITKIESKRLFGYTTFSITLSRDDDE